ncbi:MULTISPECIES: iron ABC transporter permease [unclassified Pseudomonas]|uniref:FecCD family ABC transporter permease n=1 Tax=unclassified Pseudomonas TaxID=196821 RepID=UPI001297F8EB|nr:MULTISPECIES: iron ABC transporter permease [unclassified Pseudomonas]MQT41033.1 iron chelate uptake ABC transporter family permease subunit [Pseudomonas sp. FSL R10-0765]MQT50605.1 iron chelate uptake ABC transporter family permease subunit [Pseudomonas sp. FSL R10-2398]MQT99472.1 iron chelate uptake ABC transporter family permease subunit [Pseudomonas sp. FSL R10-2245]MQU13205.1 iron chelate uptake ABC transporter family permease subunit [Pseudomonas sp. FSL R10-2189]MQU37750.1 iron chela
MTAHLNPAVAAASHGYRRLLARRVGLLAGIGVALVAAVLLDLSTGSSGMTLGALADGLLHPQSLAVTDRVIIWNVRLPYALMAVLVGAALSLAGAEMQAILNNPLASPFTLGVSSAAALGASLIIVFPVSSALLSRDSIVALSAFVFACGSMFLLHGMSRLRGAGVETLVLFGIALVFSCNALVALLQLMATEDVLQQLVFWSLGSVARANWDKLSILAVVLALILPFSLHASSRMTLLRMGEDRAQSFGVDVRRLRFFSLLRISLLSATAVAFVGTIGFIGLVGPHIARILIGEDQRFLFPASALVGALLLSLSSVVSKIIMPGVIVPVGIVTALVGVPIFVALVFKRGRQL